MSITLDPALPRVIEQVARRTVELLAEQGTAPVSRRVLNLRQTAEALDLHLTSVLKLVATGELPSKKFGKRVLIRVDDIDAFVIRLPDGGPKK